ncbi:hypothetical protein [Nitrospira japonica]|uniref:hypothetical protein n=1 Tax=Nitrospira japonica TaxID=1325564 RepID=UPI0012DD0999|nr:hypothetical protein [Nitrospira japonica]
MALSPYSSTECCASAPITFFTALSIFPTRTVPSIFIDTLGVRALLRPVQEIRRRFDPVLKNDGINHFSTARATPRGHADLTRIVLQIYVVFHDHQPSAPRAVIVDVRSGN